MRFKSEEICFKQVWMGERKGRGEGGGGRFGVHAQRVRLYDATYLHRPACSILQLFFLSTLGICIWGVQQQEKLSGLVLAKHSLCRLYFTYVSTYQRHPIRYSFNPPPFPSSTPKQIKTLAKVPGEKRLLLIGIISLLQCCTVSCTIKLLLT